MDNRESDLAEALHTAGRRLTRQRQLVLEILEESREHLDAEALHARAKTRDPRISLATVYRALSVLKDMGMVEEHQLGEEHAHYEQRRKIPHFHFVCTICGRVSEFSMPQVLRAVRALEQREGLIVTDLHLSLKGLCTQCQHTTQTPSQSETHEHDES